MFADVEAKLKEWIVDPYLRGATIIAVSVLAALIIRFIMGRWLVKLTARTKTDFDDKIIEGLKRPVFSTVILLGFAWALSGLTLGPTFAFVAFGLIKSVAVVVWASGAMRVGSLVLHMLSRNADRLAAVQPRTLPLFDILLKLVVLGSATYFALLSWHINVTGWLASAGIVGIAVGFAAKDTLANLFAGIFIVADAPYKLGDFVVLESGERGEVTDIGIRSTRILTRDDIEVTVPNAVIGNGKIINETAGPHKLERVRVTVDVAYGSDCDEVREVMLTCADGVEHVAPKPAPRVRFRELAASGLTFQLMAWIDEPVLRGRTLDKLNQRVYDALNEAGIEIPYAKQDIYIKEMPQATSGE